MSKGFPSGEQQIQILPHASPNIVAREMPEQYDCNGFHKWDLNVDPELLQCFHRDLQDLIPIYDCYSMWAVPKPEV